MRIAILLALGAMSLLSTPGFAVEPAHPVPTPPIGPGRPNPPITRTPEEIEADAQALLEEARACTEDVGCDVVSFNALVGPNNCVAAFQCSAAVSADLDTLAFTQVAAPLVEEKRASGQCAMAGCAPPSGLEATCVAGRCEILQAFPTRPQMQKRNEADLRPD